MRPCCSCDQQLRVLHHLHGADCVAIREWNKLFTNAKRNRVTHAGSGVQTSLSRGCETIRNTRVRFQHRTSKATLRCDRTKSWLANLSTVEEAWAQMDSCCTTSKQPMRMATAANGLVRGDLRSRKLMLSLLNRHNEPVNGSDNACKIVEV